MRPKRVYARTQKNICHNIFLSLVFYHKLIYYFKIRTWNCLNQQTGCMYVLECAIITFYVCRLTFVVMTFVGLVPTFAVRTFAFRHLSFRRFSFWRWSVNRPRPLFLYSTWHYQLWPVCRVWRTCRRPPPPRCYSPPHSCPRTRSRQSKPDNSTNNSNQE